ncbi:MAG: NUDIX hydrolase [Flavobacteriaceae bacterium]|jgi:ADP-ribose pyrophosphatase YjhB (NUDIX family)|tara:strand:- start:1117 stop:1707 length:591 start_codon:yes stop_codon:yes gene_type:complete
MYKVFVNRLIINLTSDKEFLNDSKTYLLSSISIKEIIKKLKIHDEVFLYYPDKKKLLKEFKEKLVTIKATGGIVTNKKNQILFIYRKGKWDLPKGKMEKNESKKESALREVIEETGVKKLKIINFFSTTFHLIKVKREYFLKETHWYTMKTKYDGKLKPQKSEGIISAKWKTFDEALEIKKKTFRNIAIILTKYLK